MHNDERTTEYFEKLGALRLSEAARTRISAELNAYTEFHPLPEGVSIPGEDRSMKQVPRGTILLIRILTIRIPTMAAFLIIALLIGGGTSYAAAGSLPGEILYPVKVHLNENVETALALTPQAKARVNADLVNARLNEAATLAAQGKLSTSTSAELNANLQEHYNAARSESSRAAVSGDLAAAASVHAALAGSLSTYATVLDRLNAQITGNAGNLLITNVRTYADAIDQSTTTVGTDSEANAHVNVVIKQTNGTLNEVESKLDHAKSTLSTGIYTNLQTQLKTAATAANDAQTHFDAKEYQQAFDAAQSAMTIAKQAEATVNTSIRLKAHTETEHGQAVDVPQSDTHTNATSSSNDTSATLQENTNIQLHTDNSSSGTEAETSHESSATPTHENTDTEIKTNINTDVSLPSTLKTSATSETNTGVNL